MPASSPTWRNDLVVAVRSLLQRPGALEHFQLRFRGWQENSTRIQEAQKAFKYVNDLLAPEEKRHRLLHRLDGGPLSVEEAYFVVALVYDTLMASEFPSHKIAPQLAQDGTHAGYIVSEWGMANDPPRETDGVLVNEALDQVRRDLDETGIIEISSPINTKSPQPLAELDAQPRPKVSNDKLSRPFFAEDLQILVAMSELDADDRDSRCSATKIAAKMDPPKTRDEIRDGLDRLRQGEYVQSLAHGNRGGFWLNAKGRKKLPGNKAKRKCR